MREGHQHLRVRRPVFDVGVGRHRRLPRAQRLHLLHDAAHVPVRRPHVRVRRRAPPRAANPSKTFLGGLNYDTTEEGLRQYFESKYGHVADAHVVRERDTQRSRGFGFVTFSDPDVARAVQASWPGAAGCGQNALAPP